MKVPNQIAHDRDAAKMATWAEAAGSVRRYVEWEAGHTFDSCVALSTMHHNNEGKRAALESGLHERVSFCR